MKLGYKYPLDNNLARLAGCFCVLSHCIYYVLFTYFIPQIFEGLYWRASYIVVSVPIMIIDYWPKALRRFLIVYWHFFLMYSWTFAGAYLTLRNDFSTLWMMSDSIMLYTLNVLIDSLKLLALNLLVGVLLAIACHSYVTNEVIIINDVGAFFMLPGLFICSMIVHFIKMKGVAALEKILL